MYETPIKMMQRQLEIIEENAILQAVEEVGVVVDKEELIKALQYDRGQYNKGYRDGIKEFAEMLREIMYPSVRLEYSDIDILEKEMLKGGGQE